MIDLRNHSPGDRFLTKDGTKLLYVRRAGTLADKPHVMRVCSGPNKGHEEGRRHDGRGQARASFDDIETVVEPLEVGETYERIFLAEGDVFDHFRGKDAPSGSAFLALNRTERPLSYALHLCLSVSSLILTTKAPIKLPWLSYTTGKDNLCRFLGRVKILSMAKGKSVTIGPLEQLVQLSFDW